MADMTFTTPAGQTIDRHLLIAYLNTGTAQAPVWSPLGRRVEDSSMEFDMEKSTSKDILGYTNTSMKIPTITQSFDPMPLDSGDTAAVAIWNMGIKDQDVQKLSSQDMLIAHFYAGASNANFAERYSSCAVDITGLGGEGGGTIGLSTEVTYGGERTLGTVAKDSSGVVTFTPAEA